MIFSDGWRGFFRTDPSGEATWHAINGRGVSRVQDMIDVGELMISSWREGHTHTIGLVGELDLAILDGMHRKLARLEQTDAIAIVIDLSGLTFIDSSGARLVYMAHARLAGDERLSLLRGPAAVQRVFELFRHRAVAAVRRLNDPVCNGRRRRRISEWSIGAMTGSRAAGGGA